MNHFVIKIAGCVIAIHAVFPTTRGFFRDYLIDAEPEFRIDMEPGDIAFERRQSMRENALEGLPHRELSDAYLEPAAIQRRIADRMFGCGTLLFHGSVVAVDGEAYLFTARSGTGKSTHTRYWREVFGDRAVMVNDDKPFLRITDDGVMACGSPWNGKHRLGSNISLPLKAICILERGEENRISRIRGEDALFMLLQQSQRPRSPALMPRYMELVDALSKKVAFYRMQCNMSPEAARVAYAGMHGGECAP